MGYDNAEFLRLMGQMQDIVDRKYTNSTFTEYITRDDLDQRLSELKEIAEESKEYDSRFQEEKQPIDVIKIITALDKISDRLFKENNVYDAQYLKNAVVLLKSDFTYETIKDGAKTEHVTIGRLNNFLNEYECYMHPEEIMIVCFAMYLIRIKFKDARIRGILPKLTEYESYTL